MSHSSAMVALHRLAAPAIFDRIAERLLPWLMILAVALFCTGLVWGLAFAPPDYQQGDSYRIIFIHVPAAALGMGLYVAMAISGAMALIWHVKVAGMVARSCAPIGAVLTLLALATGALWGKPMWGTYWVWDARLTSTLVLFFLYLGFIGLQQAFDDRERATRAAAVLALAGLVNIPIIKFSVDWWFTLHQGATLLKFGRPAMPAEMLWPLLVMMAAYSVIAAVVVLLRVRNEILLRRLDQPV